MRQTLEKWIESTQNKIFAYQFKEAGQEVLSGVELFAGVAGGLPKGRIEEFNSLIAGLLSALQKNDYLLLADILEYNIKPFLHSIEQGGKA